MKKILIVRRDNIGDLICTLPLIRAIRNLNPTARVDLLVNSYSAAVAVGNPDIDHLYVYTKAKHRSAGESVLSVHLRRLWMTLQLRLTRYDWLVLANAGCMPRPLRWAKQVAASNVVGFSGKNCLGVEVLSHPVPFVRKTGVHEVEYLMQLLQPFGSVQEIPLAHIKPEAIQLERARRILQSGAKWKPLLGINISARLPSQQWPAENFVAIIRKLHSSFRCVLFWAPGSANNPGHPGDDEKAAEIIGYCSNMDLTPFPTKSLDELVAGVSCIDFLITADGGALHIGAGLGKPIIALFGGSDSKQWYPWGVPHIILHPASQDVRSITVSEVIDAVDQLIKRL